jgi:hypothetical protein
MRMFAIAASADAIAASAEDFEDTLAEKPGKREMINRSGDPARFRWAFCRAAVEWPWFIGN